MVAMPSERHTINKECRWAENMELDVITVVTSNELGHCSRPHMRHPARRYRTVDQFYATVIAPCKMYSDRRLVSRASTSWWDALHGHSNNAQAHH